MMLDFQNSAAQSGGSTQISDLSCLLRHIRRELDLQHAELPRAYYYQSLPFCFIDAVFSIGVRYEQVENVVSQVASAAGWKLFREPATLFPQQEEQVTVAEFVAMHDSHRSPEVTLYSNRCFSNPSANNNRISKADLVRKFAQVLVDHHVNCFQDLANNTPAKLENELRSLPSLSSGVAVRYFRMLAGDDDQVKPDRMIHRFITAALKRNVSNDEAVALIREAAKFLPDNFPRITPRLLDHEIWRRQRGGKSRARLSAENVRAGTR